MRCVLPAAAALSSLLAPLIVRAQDVNELAKQLSNPVASLISVPFQSNFEFGAGVADDGFGYTMNIQPVVPISVGEDWNVISRTILPVAFRGYLPEPDGNKFGTGDTTQSLFLSPKEPGRAGFVWGLGPAFLIPTASNDFLGADKFGIGPTAVVLRQTGPWTVGALGNHIWSMAGDEAREDISQTFIQPFITYGFGRGITLSANTETTYDWKNEQFTVPVNIGATKVFQFGGQMMSVQLGGKYYAERPEDGPKWGIRTTLTFLFPQR